ncbi:MAG: FtsX-like permease family protein, partial [Bacteroidota bacterium]|nr:FtsX-like permease family protein [Bacteroidota bacterium]
KALGAKSTFIRGQFLIESIVLTIFGGLLGIALVGALTYAVSAYSDFNVQLTLKTIFEGISISALIGTIFGLIPAISAAKMDPVQAIRSN